MKKYSEYYNEITPNELFDGLIGYGLFAEKIPNFLTSETFLRFIQNNNTEEEKKPKDYIRFTFMRNINIPRVLAIPEPFAYVKQCSILKKHWNKLRKYFTEKTISDKYKISRIHLRKIKDKPYFFEMNYKNFANDRLPEQDIIIKNKYVVSADIASCFPSIYTHSIPWALVTKTIAKQKSKPSDKTEWFNELDTYTRNIKYGETNGLLIGPHSSNLISEIILVAIDNQLSKNFEYIRNIDDYTCYVASYEKAEEFLLCLSEELKKYELTLNSKKTKITQLPQATIEKWVNKLNHFNFIDTYKIENKSGVKI